MNHRFLLRLVTNVAVSLLTLSCFGIVLWVIDEFLGWDILPDVWTLLVQALLVAGGIITFVLLVMNMMLSLALMAEAQASRAQLPDFTISRRFKRNVRRGVVAGVVAIALLIGGLQVVNQVRAQAAIQAARTEFHQTQAEMDQSLEQVLMLFTPPLLEAIGAQTLAEKGQLGNLQKLFTSIQDSFPHEPSSSILVRAAQAPYQYASIDKSSIQANKQGGLFLAPKLYTSFPEERETQAVEQLFSGEAVSLTDPLRGRVLNNTTPSSWGILNHEGRTIALVYLQASVNFDQHDWSKPRHSFHHSGPDQLLTN